MADLRAGRPVSWTFGGRVLHGTLLEPDLVVRGLWRVRVHGDGASVLVHQGALELEERRA